MDYDSRFNDDLIGDLPKELWNEIIILNRLYHGGL